MGVAKRAMQRGRDGMAETVAASADPERAVERLGYRVRLTELGRRSQRATVVHARLV
jgi:hypothetical protein